jgi:fatty acyl-CoA reductase
MFTVIPTYREPVRGWTDNMYGPAGLFMGAGHGVVHCSRIRDNLTLDMVPVDFVVNCMIAAAWKTANEM